MAQNTAPHAIVSATIAPAMRQSLRALRRPRDHADDRHHAPATARRAGDRRPPTPALRCRVGAASRGQPVGARRVAADAGRQEAADERADQEQSVASPVVIAMPLARSSRIQRRIITARSIATSASTSARDSARSICRDGASPTRAMSIPIARIARIDRGDREADDALAAWGLRACGLRATKVRVSNRFLRILKTRSSVPV